jgi:tetratricopeptide (TPR) repeat protein
MRASSLAVFILTASAVACSHRSAGDATVERDAVERLPSAEFALGYRPGAPSGAPQAGHSRYRLGEAAGDGPGELEIKRAQDRLRARPGQAGDYARLAQAFFQRERETADSSYAAYAADALMAAEARDPRDPDVLTATILRQHQQHQFAEARETARTLIAAAPDRSIGFLLLGDALLELGDYPGATEAYQTALDMHPDLRSYSRGAYIRWLHGDVDGALELMEQALQAAGPGGREPAAWCYVEVGDMLRRRGEYGAAAKAAEAALGLVPGYLPARALRARVRGLVGERDQAIAELADVVAQRPTAEHLLVLAELLEQAGRNADAAARLAQADKLAGHDPLPLAVYYARHRRAPERALRLAERAVRERPSIFALDAHALALLRAGRLTEAREAISSALRLGTPSAELHLHRGLIELAAGERKAAAASLSRARAIEPDADAVLVAELERGLGRKEVVR